MKLVWKHTMPNTIDELRTICARLEMPLEQMRFFIGEDCREPCAFGVYRNDMIGQFVVYKNQRDGSRSTGYVGGSEKVAVRLFAQKIGQQIALRRSLFGTDAPESTTSVLEAVLETTIVVVAWIVHQVAVFSDVYVPTSTSAARAISPVPIEDWEASDWANWDSSRTDWAQSWHGR